MRYTFKAMRYNHLHVVAFLALAGMAHVGAVYGSAFSDRIAKSSNQDAAISLAVKEIKNLQSKYRMEAVEFLRVAKATHTIKLLKAYANDRDIQTFVLFALGDLQAFEATDILIALLDHPNQNVGADAYKALGKIYPLELPSGYAYNQPIRQKQIYKKATQQWWKTHQADLEKSYKRNLSASNQESQRLWDTYGKSYLNR